MTTIMPTDSNDHPIPVLRFKPSGAHTIAASGTSARNATAFSGETRVVSLYASVPVYVNFGGASVTATDEDHYFPSGIYYDVSIGGDSGGHASHMAVLAAGSAGSVYISEKF